MCGPFFSEGNWAPGRASAVVVVDSFTAKPGFEDAAAEVCAEIGRDFVEEIKVGLGDGPQEIRIKDGKVGVCAGAECAFGVKAGETGGGCGEPFCDASEGCFRVEVSLE